MLELIVWNRTVFDIKTVYSCANELFEENCFDIYLLVNKNYTYTKLNCLKFILVLKDLKRIDMPWNQPTNQPTNSVKL